MEPCKDHPHVDAVCCIDKAVWTLLRLSSSLDKDPEGFSYASKIVSHHSSLATGLIEGAKRQRFVILSFTYACKR